MWLGDNGLPLAMQHTMRHNAESPLPVKRDQLLIFQEIDGRLLAARTEDTFSGAVWDTKTVKASIAR
jgi:hypothetical protein